VSESSYVPGGPHSRAAYNEKVNNITNWGEIIFNRLTVKGRLDRTHGVLLANPQVSSFSTTRSSWSRQRRTCRDGSRRAR